MGARVTTKLRLKFENRRQFVTRFINTQMSFAIVCACTACVYGMRKHR
jgi:hypothetical protein